MDDEDPLSRYATLAFQFTRLLDRRKAVAIDEICTRLADKTLFDWLEAHFAPEFKLWLGVGDDRWRAEGAFRAMSTTRREKHNWTNGLALLLSYCVEAMVDPDSWEALEDDPTFPAG